jgi:hypothetical protein
MPHLPQMMALTAALVSLASFFALVVPLCAQAAPPKSAPLPPGCFAESMGAATGAAIRPKTATGKVAPTTDIPIAKLPLNQRPAALATALGLPRRVAFGVGTVDIKDVQKQGIKADIYDQYINGVGPQSWVNWNSPRGAYIDTVTRDADCIGAVPMFTLYQMASRGDNNLSGLRDTAFMRDYWDNVRTLFTRLKAYGKPALVNFEPDFWGYAQRAQRDPSKHLVWVATVNSDCASFSNDVVGLSGCLVHMAHLLAPSAYVGFPPSSFPDVATTETAYMLRIGADKADFVVMQTLDRDVGCFEARYAPAGCVRATDAKIWDNKNLKSPTFHEQFAKARQSFEALGLPLIWWQTPLGVASPSPGGQPKAFRDTRAAYFLTHADELAAAGTLGVVFSAGPEQTTLMTDGGQFKRLSSEYLVKPVALR